MKTLALRPWRPLPQARVAGLRQFGHLLALAFAAVTWLFAQYAQAKPAASWRWLDIVSESFAVLVLVVWLVQLRASRPAGHVTTWLCLGLAGLLLGAWADLMDEFWKLPRDLPWLLGLESGLNLAGMLMLTWGLHHWRGEQLAFNEQQRRRERLFREHRSLDSLTQLGDASYMLEQLALERREGRAGSLLMLAWPDLEQVQRSQGLAVAERWLEEAAQLLLLHLRPDDLLCRYAATHFLVLLPDTDPVPAQRLASQLREALSLFARTRAPQAATVQLASAAVQGPHAPETLLLTLLERL